MNNLYVYNLLNIYSGNRIKVISSNFDMACKAAEWLNADTKMEFCQPIDGFVVSRELNSDLDTKRSLVRSACL